MNFLDTDYSPLAAPRGKSCKQVEHSTNAIHSEKSKQTIHYLTDKTTSFTTKLMHFAIACFFSSLDGLSGQCFVNVPFTGKHHGTSK